MSSPFYFRDHLHVSTKRLIAKELDNFESIKEAISRRKERISLLKSVGEIRNNQQLKLLKKCRKSERCNLAVCPVCMRRFRSMYLQQTKSLFSSEGDVHLATLIPPKKQYPLGQLMEFQPGNFIERIRKQFSRTDTPGVVVTGMIDIDLQVFPHTERQKPFWQPHLHILTNEEGKDAANQLRKTVYRPSELVRKPMLIKKATSFAGASTYTVKNIGKRRYNMRSERTRNTTTKDHLKREEYSELVCWWARYQPEELMLRIGVRRRAGGKLKSGG